MTDLIKQLENDPFSTIPVGPLGIIAMPSSTEMGDRINTYLKRWQREHEESGDDKRTYPGNGRDTYLIKAACPRFGTGEAKGMLKESVRGYDLYILTDVANYACTYKMYGKEVPMSPDDHWQDLKRVIGAAAGKARRISVIMPMLYESRQHKRSSRESLDCAMALQELEALGVENIITFDAHDPRMHNAIPMTSFENVMPTYQTLKALFRAEKDLHIDPEHMMVISPDEGALNRNIYYASALGLNLGMFYKRRDYTRVVEGRNPIIAHEYMGNDVAGKDIFICDDMIASGDSMLDVARELKKRNAGRIYVGVTYAFFTSGLDAFNKAYEEGLITKVLSTNLTYRSPELKAAPWFTEVDVAKYISYLIAQLNYDHSISHLLDPHDRIQNLLTNYRAEQDAAGLWK